MVVFKHYAVTDKSIVFVVKGILDRPSFGGFLPTLWRVVANDPHKNFLFDFTDLRGVDDEAVEDLLVVYDEIAMRGGRMALAKPNHEVYTKLFLNGADLFIPIYDSFVEALAENQQTYRRMLQMYPETLFSAIH
jgi:anti-anti-sigma regulatory factor